MKQKIFITAGLLLLLIVIFFITKDLLFQKGDDRGNPYEYNLEELKKSDSLEVAFKEIKQLTPGLEEIYGIAVDPSDRIYVSGNNGVEIFYNTGKPEKKFKINGIASTIIVDGKGMIYLGIEDHVEVMRLENGSAILHGLELCPLVAMRPEKLRHFEENCSFLCR